MKLLFQLNFLSRYSCGFKILSIACAINANSAVAKPNITAIKNLDEFMVGLSALQESVQRAAFYNNQASTLS